MNRTGAKDRDMITRELSCELTDTEKQAKGSEIARTYERFEEIEQEKKDRTKDLSDQMKELRKQTKKLARQLREGKELRAVECDEERDYRTGVLRITRIDTGEVIETRPLTIQERQVPLQVVQPKAKKAAPKEAEAT